jgi:hypothetical protein
VLHSEPRPRLLNRPAHLPASLAARTANAGDFNVPLTPTNTFFLQLDMAGASTAPGGGLIDWWVNGNANQGWTFRHVYDSTGNYYIIINDNSWMCLYADGTAGDQVYQAPCDAHNTYGEIWYTGLNPSTSNATYGWAIENVSSGLYLDVAGDNPFPGASIDTWPWNGQPNQYFAID